MSYSSYEVLINYHEGTILNNQVHIKRLIYKTKKLDDKLKENNKLIRELVVESIALAYGSIAMFVNITNSCIVRIPNDFETFKLSYYNEYKSYLRHDYIDGYVYKQLINGVKVSRCRVVRVVDWKFSSAHSHIILIASNSG